MPEIIGKFVKKMTTKIVPFRTSKGFLLSWLIIQYSRIYSIETNRKQFKTHVQNI